MNKKRILFAGASGYGNLGDDSYKILFTKYFTEMGYEVKFDSPYPDLDLVKWADHVVIGGGGLIYVNNTAHLEYMTSYLEQAEKLGKSYSFLSCGVQIYKSTGDMSIEKLVEMGIEQIEPWVKYLKNAKLITVRSEECKQIIDGATEGKANCYYVPDMAYAYVPPKVEKQKGLGILIPTKASLKNPKFEWAWAHLNNTCEKIYVVAMAKDDYDIVRNFGEIVKMRKQGDYFTDISPREALALVGSAEVVMTGRYHGGIFSRVCGLPEGNIYNVDQRYKSRVENPPQDKNEALRTIELFKQLNI